MWKQIDPCEAILQVHIGSVGAAFTLELTLAATLASVPSALCMYREIFHFSSGEQEPCAALRAASALAQFFPWPYIAALQHEFSIAE